MYFGNRSTMTPWLVVGIMLPDATGTFNRRTLFLPMDGLGGLELRELVR